MTLKLAKPITAKLAFRKTWQPMDSDAAAYITAVETADGQALEEKVKIAIDNFVLGCKADGIWNAIKASCILAGARTLNGALVPLAGAAPTNFNFVAGDYNRKTGLMGNGSTKYLDSNRNNNADPQNNVHISVFASEAATAAMFYCGYGGGLSGTTGFYRSGSDIILRNRSSSTGIILGAGPSSQFIATSRSDSAVFVSRSNRASFSYTVTSQVPANGNIHLFGDGQTTSLRSNARLAFYSIGESLNLALLDARVTDLINAFGAAIP